MCIFLGTVILKFYDFTLKNLRTIRVECEDTNKKLCEREESKSQNKILGGMPTQGKLHQVFLGPEASAAYLFCYNFSGVDSR